MLTSLRRLWQRSSGGWDPDNFRFDPYEQFLFDTEPVKVEVATLQAAHEEATYGLNYGLVDPVEATMASTKAMDDA